MSIEQILAKLPEKSAEQRQKFRTNAARALETGNAARKAEAQALVTALDALEAAEEQAFSDRLAAMSRAEKVIAAFRAHPPTKTEAKAIQALLDHPGSTSSKLSVAFGGRGQIWHRWFGDLCKKRQDYLWPAAYVEKRDGYFYSGILADLDSDGNRFTMKPDVAEAFAALGIKPRSA